MYPYLFGRIHPAKCGGGEPCPPGAHCVCNSCDCNDKGTSCGDGGGTDGHPCQSGWYPDPLLDVPAGGIPRIPKSFSQPIHLEVCVPYGQPAGNYSGRLVVSMDSPASSGFTVPVALEVWDIDLPLLNDTAAFNTAFSFSEHLERWYPPNTSGATIWEEWLPFLAHHRVPGDAIYLGGPRPVDEYKVLASQGAKWMNMEDVSFRIPGGLNSPVPQSYIDGLIKQFEPTMATMTELGLVDKMYVYGFDEMIPAYNRSLYEVYGGLKQHWPSLTTIATLNWDTMPADLPLDVWVNSYSDYGVSPSYLQPTAKEQTRQRWLASKPGRQFWWYWSLFPLDPVGMNTFVERPAIEARLLYWLTALHAVNGMLYYSVDIWQDQCPSMRPCTPVRRINNTALTDFKPATYPNPKAGSLNGDGSFTYPGEGGKPLGSIRLSNIADGIEVCLF